MITEEDEKKVINYYGVGNNGETGRHLKDKRKGFDFHKTQTSDALSCLHSIRLKRESSQGTRTHIPVKIVAVRQPSLQHLQS
ncbi:hypothetical protein NC652_020019 [Populus alba x Populus x berolinensis]|nr:hypothetical protein NC652_020019 [Populus alba x Populus x berolinensis]